MKLNNYTLKAVKMMNTLDGVSFSGNIYFGNKKIGVAYNDGNGGMTNVHLQPEHKEHYPTLTENFIERLFTLVDYEKIYKAETKKHPDKCVAFVDYKNFFEFNHYICAKDATESGLREHIQKTYPEREIESIEFFRSLDDFNITQSFEEGTA